MSHTYSEDELREYFFSALCDFQGCFDTDICKDNVLLAFFTPEDGVEVYELFCGEHFPKSLAEPYREEGYFESFAAQAFLNEKEYGVLIRADIDFSLSELHQVFLHELSHLYCTRSELGGGNFYDTYCMGSGLVDGAMSAGYAVWREAIADIMADAVISDYTQFSLADNMIRRTLHSLYGEITMGNRDAKKAMSLIIVYVMLSAEVAGTNDWIRAKEAIKKNIGIDDALLYAILEQVFEKLHTRPSWRITPEFILTLGETYISMVAQKQLKEVVKRQGGD